MSGRAFHRSFSAVRATIALALLTLSAPGAAWAGPPFQTDDPEPTPYRYYEIYVNSGYAAYEIFLGPKGKAPPPDAR